MSKNILAQEYYSDQISQKLVSELEEVLGDEIEIYYRFPLIKELDQEVKFPDVLVVSKIHGIVAFKCTEISKIRVKDEVEILSDEISWIEDYLFSRLIKSNNKALKKGRRELSFNLTSAIYAPNFTEGKEECDTDIIISTYDVKEYFDKIKGNEISKEVMGEISSIIDGSTGIVKPKERYIDKEDISSKAYVLKKLEQEIAVFDENQKYAALSQLKGPQRIRGLAGSGKTIILAMKAAIIHLNDPGKKILYTFMTKSLYDYIQELITRFYKVLGDGNLPDFENSIHIRHAWGGTYVKGVYYDTCQREQILPLSFNDARYKSMGKGIFDFICTDLMAKKKGKFEQYYDYILIDEAQDFRPSFYQLCRAIVKNDSIVWGYDDLQNIYNVNIQDTLHTFKNDFGYEGIDLRRLQEEHPDMENDIVLSKSYRNPKEILVLAHAIGFGIYNEILIQTLENNEHWQDLGYQVVEGNCKDGDEMSIVRPIANSPLAVSSRQKIEEIIKHYSAEDFEDECKWVACEIESAINNDKLRPDDIIVISLDDKNSKAYFEEIAFYLTEREILTYNLSSVAYQKGFYRSDCVTLTTLYKAKGNEAAMVFVVGCDVFEGAKNSKSMRNKIFTAFTRAKAWLRISGVKIADKSLVREIEEVKKNNFELRFTYKEAEIIKRDLADINKKRTEERESVAAFFKDRMKDGMSKEEIQKILIGINEDEQNE